MRRRTYGINQLSSIAQSDLILWYDAIANNGGTTFKDLSSAGNNATINNCTWNKGLVFNGSSSYLVTSKNLLSASTPITIEMLDLDGALYQNTSLAMILELSYNTNNNQNTFYFDINETVSKRLGMMQRANYSTYGYNGNNIPNQSFIMTCKFGQGVSLLINNQAETITYSHQNNASSVSFSTAQKLYIGSRGGSSLFTKMNLASLKIWNRLLTADEITSSYNYTKKRYGI